MSDDNDYGYLKNQTNSHQLCLVNRNFVQRHKALAQIGKATCRSVPYPVYSTTVPTNTTPPDVPIPTLIHNPYRFRPAISCSLLILMTSGFSSAGYAAKAEPNHENDIASTDATSQPTVKIIIEGLDEKLLANAQGFLEVYQFEGKAAPSTARLNYLHRAAPAQIAKALKPFGYFQATVKSDIEQSDSHWQATYTVKKGKPIIVESLNIALSGEAQKDPLFIKAISDSGLTEKQPLDQQAYENLKKRFQILAAERGYFDAVLEKGEIRVKMADYKASIDLRFKSGQRYRLGKVVFNQDKTWLKETLLQRFVDIEPGQFYDASDLQRLQGDLSNTQYYQQVEIDASPKRADRKPPATPPNSEASEKKSVSNNKAATEIPKKAEAELMLPVQVELLADEPRRYLYGLGYGTDTGARVRAGIEGRRLNNRGHHYTTEMLFSQIGYGVAAEYVIPGQDPRTDAYGIRASWEREDSDTRQYKSFRLGGYYTYSDGNWLKTYATDYLIETYDLSGASPSSRLLMPSAEWTRTIPSELEKRIYATNGTYLQLRVRGAHETLLSDTSFIQPLISVKNIRSFGDKGKLITRATIASSLVSEFRNLPSSLRLYAGGDKSVRGYGYNVIAPTDDEGNLLGGKHLLETSIEYEFPLKNSWSIAAFVDAGDAFDDSPEMKVGVGLGLHWASPIGPVRLDFGHGLEQPVGTVYRLHLTIGPDL